MDTSTLMGIFTAIVAPIALWGARTEGRLNGHDQKFVSSEKLTDERHKDLVKRFDRLEGKIDDLVKTNGKPAR